MNHLHNLFCLVSSSLVAQIAKNLPTMQEFSSVAQSCPTLCDPMDCSIPGFLVQSLGQEDPLEKGMATHSSILA